MKCAIILPLFILISQSIGMPISDAQSATEELTNDNKNVLNMMSNYAHVRIMCYFVNPKIYHWNYWLISNRNAPWVLIIILFKVRNSGGSIQLLSELSHAASSQRFAQPEFAGTGRSLGFEFPDFDPSFSTSQMFGRNVNMVPLKNDEVMVPAPVFIPEKWSNKDWNFIRLENKF